MSLFAITRHRIDRELNSPLPLAVGFHSVVLFVLGCIVVCACTNIDSRFYCTNPAFEEMYEYEIEGTRPRGRPKRTWREVVEKDCQAHKFNKEDSIDHSRWRKLIKDVW